MILTAEDISAVKDAVVQELNPRFEEINQRFAKVDEDISNLTHQCNKRFTAIELRLHSIEYKLSQIAVFVPFENAFVIPPIKKRSS